MVLSGISIPATEVYGASDDSPTATKGVYWFDGREVGNDLTDTYVYDDELLKGNSLEYNSSLASMTYELAVASISSEREQNTAEGYAIQAAAVAGSVVVIYLGVVLIRYKMDQKTAQEMTDQLKVFQNKDIT